MEPFYDSFSVLGFGNASQEVGKVILASGVLDMGIELGPFSHEVISSSEEIPRCAHFGRVDISLRKHASPEQGGDLMGVDLIVFGFSSMDSFHVEGMAKDEGNIFFRTEISDPVPGEHTFRSDNQVFAEGRYDVQEGFLVRFDVLVDPYLASRVEDTDKHFFGVKVDSAIVLVLFGVKSHWASSFGLKCFLVPEAFYHASGGGLK
jgi:hypothetical protein